MKKIVSYIGRVTLVAVMALGFTACSPEEFAGPDKAGIPLASDYADAVKINVDQQTNTAYFTFDPIPGITPVWIIDGKKYTSTFATSQYYRKAGDYTVEVKISNANGISDGTISKTFHIDKTKMTGFGGFVYESEFNLWTKATIANPTFWFADASWSQIADPSYSLDNGVYTVNIASAIAARWQGQMALGTSINTSSAKTYDFSVILTSTKDHPGVMVKLTDSTNDGSFYFEKEVALVANEPLCFWKSDMPGIDANLKLVFDFGGSPENNAVIIESIVLKDHADDDGTVLPDVDDTPEPNWVAVDSDDNLWKGVSYTNGFYYAPGWNQIGNPTLEVDGTTYTLDFPTATFERWQAQASFVTDGLALSAAEEYDFQVTLNATNSIKGVTVKLGQQLEGTDDPALFTSQVDLEAGADFVFKAKKQAGVDMERAKLIFDFGGNPAGTTVTIKNIILQVHKD